MKDAMNPHPDAPSLAPPTGEALSTEPPPPVLSHERVIANLARTIEGVLEPLLPREGPIALLDFPQAPNVGDSLIWLGVLAYLRRAGRGAPCYTCTDITYEKATLARRVGKGTILLSGGGNFGDLYPSHQRLREQVIADFPQNRIIQLPQSIHFDTPVALARAARVIDRHPDLTLLVRDHSSLRLARESFRAPSQLCPDMSFCLGPLPRPTTAGNGIVWLSRIDKETATREPVHAPPGVRPVDWVQDDHSLLVRYNRFLTRNARHRPRLRPWLIPVLGPTYSALLEHRLDRGCRTLARGEVVATNRLHGYILSLLMGIPHYFADNSYGKVRSFHEAWTRECAISHACGSESEALRLAASALRGAPPAMPQVHERAT